MPDIDLTPHDWAEVAHILQRHVPELQVWAFGSRVKWTAKAYSDLDVALITSEALPLERFAALKEAFDESNLSIRVDLVDWAATSESFRGIIDRDKVVIQKATNDLGIGSKWVPYKISEIGRVVTGKTPQTSNPTFQGSDVPFVTPSDFNGEKWIRKTARTISEEGAQSVKNCILPPSAVLVSCIGSDMGKAALSSRRCVTNQQINAVIVESGRFTPEFIFYNLSLRKDEIQQMAGGSAQPILNKSAFSEIWIDCPSLGEQQAIVETIRPLDDRITLLRETNATLEAIAQALFKSWFVDFDPVRARMEGRAPEGMDETTAALIPDGLEESALGLVPRGWRIGTLQDLLLLQRGFDLPSDNRVPGDYPIIAASGPSGTHNVPMAKAPGVVTGRSGVLGRVFLELDDYWPLNTTLWIKEFRAATPCYAYELLRLLDLKSFNAGSAVPTLNRNHIHGLTYLVPPRDCVAAYEAIAIQLHERARLNDEQAQILATLRDTLLPRLFSGQLRLLEAEAQNKACGLLSA